VADSEALTGFILRAKCATYAAQGDDATVTALLLGSRQLEYREGDLFYRDVYFGMAAFAGLETAHDVNVPRWSMAYAGGVIGGTSRGQMSQVYTFLRSTLQRGTLEAPFRGPSRYESFGYEYVNEWRGRVEDFSGAELIRRDRAVVYRLNYAGGHVR
jgi:Domain of unknown function (DUF5680)